MGVRKFIWTWDWRVYCHFQRKDNYLVVSKKPEPWRIYFLSLFLLTGSLALVCSIVTLSQYKLCTELCDSRHIITWYFSSIPIRLGFIFALDVGIKSQCPQGFPIRKVIPPPAPKTYLELWSVLHQLFQPEVSQRMQVWASRGPVVVFNPADPRPWVIPANNRCSINRCKIAENQ